MDIAKTMRVISSVQAKYPGEFHDYPLKLLKEIQAIWRRILLFFWWKSITYDVIIHSNTCYYG